MQAENLAHTAIVDCTASTEMAACYADWLEAGIHVVTPNKKAGSASLEDYKRLRKLGRRLNTHWFYEATVGAGLPVITTLRDLIQTGDRILRIEAVLSGTLSYLFNTFSSKHKFSELVRHARDMGFTERDPREDLSGVDVARKAVILAREAGLDIELEGINVESLVPKPLVDVAEPEAFLDGLRDFDEAMELVRSEAEQEAKVLRYVAVLEMDGTTDVGLRRFSKTHAFARLSGGDNIIAFTTERYRQEALMIQGPGAGPEVTAGGVFGDLLRLASYLGAPS